MKTGAGAGLVFISPLGVRMRYAIRLHFPASNNAAEYEALVNGLHIAIELGIKRLDVPGPDPEASTAQEQEAMDIESEPPAPDDSPDWRYPLLQRLVDVTLPSDQAEAWRVARRAKTFVRRESSS